MNAAAFTALARLLLVALLWPATVLATTVYRTVDEHGAVRFSDTPPAGLIPVDTLEINTAEPLQRAEERREGKGCRAREGRGP